MTLMDGFCEHCDEPLGSWNLLLTAQKYSALYMTYFMFAVRILTERAQTAAFANTPFMLEFLVTGVSGYSVG
jgi:hypothetical protein